MDANDRRGVFAFWLFGIATAFVAAIFAVVISLTAAPSIRPNIVRSQPRSTGSPLVPSTAQLKRERISHMTVGEEYTVDCRIVGKNLAFSLPRLVVRDGEKVTLSDTTQGQRVSSSSAASVNVVNGSLPTWEGTKAEIAILTLNDRRALLDVTIEFRSVNGRHGSNQGGQPRLQIQKMRLIQHLSRGEMASTSTEDCYLEVVVR